MKSLHLSLLAAILGCCSVAHAQLLLLTGHLTSATGSYEGVFAAGDAVTVSLDFSESWKFGNVLPGDPGKGHYYATGQLIIAGTSLPTAAPTFNVGVTFFDAPSANEGLRMSVGWGGMVNAVDWQQNLFGPHDLLSSINDFPANLPFSAFTETTGAYRNYFVTNSSVFNYTGELHWEITSYTGSAHVQLPEVPPPVVQAVPESSTIGLVAACCLGLPVLTRRAIRKRRK